MDSCADPFEWAKTGSWGTKTTGESGAETMDDRGGEHRGGSGRASEAVHIKEEEGSEYRFVQSPILLRTCSLCLPWFR